MDEPDTPLDIQVAPGVKIIEILHISYEKIGKSALNEVNSLQAYISKRENRPTQFTSPRITRKRFNGITPNFESMISSCVAIKCFQIFDIYPQI